MWRVREYLRQVPVCLCRPLVRSRSRPRSHARRVLCSWHRGRRGPPWQAQVQQMYAYMLLYILYPLTHSHAHAPTHARTHTHTHTQADLLTDKGYTAMGLHMDAAILAPSNPGTHPPAPHSRTHSHPPQPPSAPLHPTQHHFIPLHPTQPFHLLPPTLHSCIASLWALGTIEPCTSTGRIRMIIVLIIFL